MKIKVSLFSDFSFLAGGFLAICLTTLSIERSLSESADKSIVGNFA